MINIGIKDFSGQKFGKLTVIKDSGYRRLGSVVWICKCDCGNFCSAISTSLQRKDVPSCGCYKHEKLSQAAKVCKNRTTHGMKNSKIYGVWQGIKYRCNNPNCSNFKNYGARGISISPLWEHDFQAFYDYVSALPHYGEEGYSIDRIDNDGKYERNNIRWATKSQQGENTRSSIHLEIDGVDYPLKQISRFSGVCYTTLCNRHKRGAPILKEEEKQRLLKKMKEEKEKLRNGSKNRNLSTTG